MIPVEGFLLADVTPSVKRSRVIRPTQSDDITAAHGNVNIQETFQNKSH